MSAFAQHAIEQPHLSPHPEGGWYRRTWASTLAAGGGGLAPEDAEESSAGEKRPLASLIYFLLLEGEASAWHKVDADEIWLWHGPAPLALELGETGDCPDEAHTARHQLGITETNCATQLVIPASTWQRTLPGKGDVLVSCVVSPASSMRDSSLQTSLPKRRRRLSRARLSRHGVRLHPCVPRRR
ncbi:MAG: cupin domain-containing protein [Atopobiaceae bacterium]